MTAASANAAAPSSPGNSEQAVCQVAEDVLSTSDRARIQAAARRKSELGDEDQAPSFQNGSLRLFPLFLSCHILLE
jgi:hypothetical protein